MSEAATAIPRRALFKLAEVCEIASVQPYVLRSWESEFPDLGVRKDGGAARMYRRADVERVLRIKQLVFVDGLTLAGVRRRIEGEAPPAAEAEEPIEELLGRNARERLATVKQGLRDILDMLSRNAGNGGRPSIQAPRLSVASKPKIRASARSSKPTGRTVRKRR